MRKCLRFRPRVLPTAVVLSCLLIAFVAGCGSGSQGVQTGSGASTASSASSSGAGGDTPSTAPPQPTQTEQSGSGGSGQEKLEPVGDPKETSISIGTHPTGSSYNVTASALAKVISENSPIKATIKPFGGPNAWMPLLNRNEVELGVSSAPDGAWAFAGTTGYPEPMKNARMLMVGYINEAPGIVVRKDSGITSITELKGKRVAHGFGGNQIAGLLIEAFLVSVGMSWDDVTKVPVPEIPSSLNLLKEKRIDATFGAIPTAPYVVEAHNAVGLVALNLADHPPDQIDSFPKDRLPDIQRIIPGGEPVVTPAGTGFLEEDRTLIGYPQVLSASAQLSDEAAYHVVKALWDNYQQLEPIYKPMAGWNPDRMFTENPDYPYHPGAVRFYKEQGLWNDTVEQRQQELMAQAQ